MLGREQTQLPVIKNWNDLALQKLPKTVGAFVQLPLFFHAMMSLSTFCYTKQTRTTKQTFTIASGMTQQPAKLWCKSSNTNIHI